MQLRFRFVLVALIGTLLFGVRSMAADLGGLKTSIAVDLVGSFPLKKQDSAEIAYQSNNAFKLRSAEFMFYAPIDARFDGVLSFAAHPEGDQSFGQPEVHEAYLSSHKLINGMRFKVGQFFLGVGRVNQIHQHDWPFITPTVLQRELFGTDEGVIDTGLEASALVPLPFYLDVTVGVTNGRDFGHSHVEDDLPKTPTHYSRIVTYAEPLGVPSQIGLNFVGRTSAVGEEMQLWGIDLTSKWRSLGYLSWLLQAELWKRQLKLGETSDVLIGGYTYLQHYITRSFALGARYDYSTVTSADDNERSGYEVNVIYRGSEFTKLGLAYYRNQREQTGRDDLETEQVLFQTAFILGAHPSHDF